MNFKRAIPKSNKEWSALLAKFAIMIGLLYFVCKDLQWAVIGNTFNKLPFHAYIWVALFQAFVQIFQALRWKLLANAAHTPFKEYVGFVSLGYFFNLIAPSILVSDGANAYLLGKRRQMMAKSFSGILTGRLFGMLALVMFILITFPFNLATLSQVRWIFDIKKMWIIFAGLGLGLVAVLAYKKYQNKISPLFKEVKANLRRPKRLLQVFILSLAIQFCLVFMGYIGFYFMEIPVGLANIYFLAPFIILIGFIPITPGQIGFRESLSLFFYTLLPGVSKEMVLANVGFGYVTFLIFGATNCLIAWILLKKKNSSAKFVD